MNSCRGAARATQRQIAKYLVEKLKLTPDKEIMQYRTSKTYSVIHRKNGSIPVLTAKGYIKEKEGLYELTTKGSIALAIEKPEVINELESADKNRAISKRDSLETVEQLKDQPALFRIFVEQTKKVLAEGVNLGQISEFALLSLVRARSEFQKLLKKLAIDTFGKNAFGIDV